MIKYYLKNILLNNLSQGLQFGSRWILTIVLLKVLSIEMFAVFSFVFSISNFLVAVLPFGSAVYLINKAEDSENGIKELAVSIEIIFFMFMGIMLCYGLYYTLSHNVENAALIPLGILLSLIFSLNTVVFSFLKGVGNFTFELKIYSIFSILVFLLTGYLYFVNAIPVFLLFLMLIIINGLMLLLAFKFSNTLKNNEIFQFRNFTFSSFKKGCSQRFFFGLQEIVTASYAQGGMLILFYVISKTIYGEYRALLILTAPFALVNVAVSQVLLSQLKSIPIDKVGATFKKLHWPFSALLASVLVVIYYFGKPIVKLITHLEYTDSIQKSFICVLIIIFISFVYSGYEMLLVVIDKQKHRFLIMLIGAITNIVSIIILLPKHGTFGAISTNLLSNLAVFIGIVFLSERFLSKLK
jgi:O-antigen/teichoic acid export membrane protein